MGYIISLSTVRNAFFYLLLACLLILPVTYFLAKSNRISFIPCYLIGISVLALIGSKEASIVWVNSKNTLLLLLLFLGYIALTALWSTEAGLKPFSLYAGYGLLIFTFIFGIAMLELRFEWFRDAFVLLLVLSATVSSCYSIYLFQHIQFDPLVNDRLYPLGALHNPVVGALSYGAVFVLAMSYLPTCADRVLQWLLIVSAAIILAGVFLTGTRSVWIGFIAAYASLVYLLPHARFRTKLALIAAGVISLVAVVTIIWSLGFDTALMARSTSFRPEIWHTVISKMLNDNLILGYGINSNASIKHAQLVFDHPHSIYISTLFYGGIVGLMLFLFIVVRIFYLSLRDIQGSSIIILTLFVFGLVCLLFDGNRLVRKIDFVWLLVWLPIAFFVAAQSQLKARQPTG